MKHYLKTLFAIVAMAAATTPAFAQATKIAVVDMAYLFDNHYKTAEQNTVFKGEQDKVKAEIQRLNGEGVAMNEEFKSISEQLNNPVLSDQAKGEIEEKAKAKYVEIQNKQNEMNALVNNSTESLRKRVLTFRTMLLDEISKIAVDVAKRQGATILLDKSGPSVLGIPAVLYSGDSLDITQSVLDEINKSKPATSSVTPATPAAAPAAGSTPAASSATPASTDAPTISLPSLKKN